MLHPSWTSLSLEEASQASMPRFPSSKRDTKSPFTKPAAGSEVEFIPIILNHWRTTKTHSSRPGLCRYHCRHFIQVFLTSSDTSMAAAVYIRRLSCCLSFCNILTTSFWSVATFVNMGIGVLHESSACHLSITINQLQISSWRSWTMGWSPSHWPETWHPRSSQIRRYDLSLLLTHCSSDAAWSHRLCGNDPKPDESIRQQFCGPGHADSTLQHTRYICPRATSLIADG